MSDFYVSLSSHSSKSEFPDNKSNHFKIRVPRPIRLNGSGGWRVGMSSISLPDARVTISSLSDEEGEDKVVLAFTLWRRVEQPSSNIYTIGRASFNTEDLKEVFYNVSGVGFMESMIAYFERQRIYANNGPKLGSQYFDSDGKRTYVKFKWEGEDLVRDNKDVLKPYSNQPALWFNVALAEKMGWIKKDGNSYGLGPNLQIEFFEDKIPENSSETNATTTTCNGGASTSHPSATLTKSAQTVATSTNQRIGTGGEVTVSPPITSADGANATSAKRKSFCRRTDVTSNASPKTKTSPKRNAYPATKSKVDPSKNPNPMIQTHASG